MFQNRVNPFGDLIKTKARGTWMGNRGLIHNDAQQIIKPFKLKAWLICQLQFKDRHRPIMAPRQWTELFFLDEATAFAAGHRPCCECRRADFDKFKLCWIKGNPEYGFTMKTPIREIDEIIHRERIDYDGVKITYEMNAKDLPSGVFVLIDGEACLIGDGNYYLWREDGYGEALQLNQHLQKMKILTPRSVVNAFGAGYKPTTLANV